MSHCVFTAFMAAVAHEERQVYLTGRAHAALHDRTYRWYFMLKDMLQADASAFTFGGIVPFIVSWLAKLNEYETFVQHRLWTPQHYVNIAQNMRQVEMIRLSDFDGLFGNEVETITLEPAIYLSLRSEHAFFAEKAPDDHMVIMAIKLMTSWTLDT